MAQIQEVRLIDDLTGEEADETIEFGLDGKSYEIDLSQDSAGKLRDALAEFVAAARRTGARRRDSSGASSGTGSRRGSVERNQVIREWARNRGMTISDRGRISSEVLAAYHQEN
jgi:hypothetical protein